MEIETVASEAKVLPPKPKFEALKPHEMSDGQIQFRKRLIWWWLSTALSSVRQHEVVVLEEGERGAFPIHRNVAVGHPHHCASPPARTPKQYEFSPTLLNPAVNIPFGDETIISSSDLSTERGSAAEEWKDKTHELGLEKVNFEELKRKKFGLEELSWSSAWRNSAYKSLAWTTQTIKGRPIRPQFGQLNLKEVNLEILA
ncbi:hypothetical protein VIGAN_01219400 [Vigna angularis var. angularis]|uniref:Uncharacterized protein n=1 Tax=Vigna angularis var. angularis TaxID=157739 RepID=A0A0S3R1Q1_PHAAN|nr:hypothetical protein VIGAN_01219400 [Vigna angularis var. angularis]